MSNYTKTFNTEELEESLKQFEIVIQEIKEELRRRKCKAI